MRKRVVLYADEGMVLTDGTYCGRVVWLAEGADPEAYYQITQAEYEARLAQAEVMTDGAEH